MNAVMISSTITVVSFGILLLVSGINAQERIDIKSWGRSPTEVMGGIVKSWFDYCQGGDGSEEEATEGHRFTEGVALELAASDALTQEQITARGITRPPVQEFLERFSGLKLGNYGQYQSPFPVKRFPDGTGTGRGTNQYAWGAAFSDDCGLGVMIHSAGTLAIRKLNLANPTLTVRDADGAIVMKQTLPVLEIGLRSAVITECSKDGRPFKKSMRSNFFRNLGLCLFPPARLFLNCHEDHADTITVFSGNVAPVFGGAKLIKLEIDIPNDTVTISNALTFGSNVTSIRALSQIDDCKLLLAPLDDTSSVDALLNPVVPPQLVVYDICREVQTTNILADSDDSPIANSRPVWDFENGPDGDVWINLIDVTRNVTDKIGEFDFSPILYKTTVSELAVDGIDSNLRLSLVPIPLDIDTSAFSLLPLGDGESILACTLSGFLYQQLTTGFSVLMNFNAHIFFNYEEFLSSTELANPQECRFCPNSAGGYACRSVNFLPSTRTAVPYIWNLVECGDYIFAGTLDINYFQANIIVDTLFGYAGIVGPFLELFGDFISDSILELTAAIGLGLFYREIMTPLDFGFDLYHAETKAIGTGAKFVPVTFDGFRAYDDDGNYRGYSPMSDVDEGVRNMVCHTDSNGKNPRLIVGSAIYGSSLASNTFVLYL